MRTSGLRSRGAATGTLSGQQPHTSSPRTAIRFSRRELGPAVDAGEADHPTPLPAGPARSTRPRAADPGPRAGRANASVVNDGPSRHSHPTRVRDLRAGICYPDFPGRRGVVRLKTSNTAVRRRLRIFRRTCNRLAGECSEDESRIRRTTQKIGRSRRSAPRLPPSSSHHRRPRIHPPGPMSLSHQEDPRTGQDRRDGAGRSEAV